MNGTSFRFYTTAVAVADYDQVLHALGYDRINLYGGSYGPTMEQAYLRQFGYEDGHTAWQTLTLSVAVSL
jgi:pimeloyl-ACP methyl ester carboxylesterase